MRRRAALAARAAGLLLTPLLALTVASCAKLPPTYYYLLEPPPRAAAGAPATAPTGLRLGVDAFAVDAPYDQSSIAYRIGSDSPRIAFYDYHQWAAPVPVMLQRAAVAALQGTRGTASVAAAAPGESYDARLSGRLLALEEIDLSEEHQQVRLRMSLQLDDAEGGEIWSDVIAAERDLQADDVTDVVREMRLLLAESLAGARSDIEARLAAHR